MAERIRAHGSALTAAERRVAEVVLSAPQSIGFGTVADLARTAGVGAASVVRLATKLGFDGYSELQQAIQAELTQQLRPAAERIHEADLGSLSEHAAAELANVRGTLTGVDDAALTTVVERLADRSHPIAVVAGDACAGVAQIFVSQMHQLRPGVQMIGGSQVAVQRDLAVLPENSSVVLIDLRRYEQWVLDAHQVTTARSLWSVAITDSMLSPLAAGADVAFVAAAASIGPFDSYVGVLALLDLIALDVASQLRDSATARLADIEAAWSERDTLTSGTGGR